MFVSAWLFSKLGELALCLKEPLGSWRMLSLNGTWQCLHVGEKSPALGLESFMLASQPGHLTLSINQLARSQGNRIHYPILTTVAGLARVQAFGTQSHPGVWRLWLRRFQLDT